MNSNKQQLKKFNRSERRTSTAKGNAARDPAYPYTVRYATLEKDIRELIRHRTDIAPMVLDSLRHLLASWGLLCTALRPKDSSLLEPDDRVEPVGNPK